MSKSNVNLGTLPNDSTGDTLYNAFLKVNLNFTELYNTLGDGSNVSNSFLVTLSSVYNLANTLTTQLNNLSNNTIIIDNNANNLSSIVTLSYNQANTGTTIAQTAYNQANTGTVIAQNAYGQANTGTLIGQNAYNQANIAYNQANTGIAIAQTAYNQANTGTAIAQNAYGQANTGTLIAQNAYNQANIAYNQANTGTAIAQTAYNKANSAYDQATSIPYLISGYSTGNFTSNSIVHMHGFSSDVYFATDFYGSEGVATNESNTQMYFDITLDDVSKGSMFFSNSYNATFTSPVGFLAPKGSILKIVSPAVITSNLEGFAFTLSSDTLTSNTTQDIIRNEFANVQSEFANVQSGFANLSSYVSTALSFNSIIHSSNVKILSANDNSKAIYFTSNTNVTVNTSSNLWSGFSCLCIQGGTGTLTFNAVANTTLRSYLNMNSSAGNNAIVTVSCPFANSFFLSGNLT